VKKPRVNTADRSGRRQRGRVLIGIPVLALIMGCSAYVSVRAFTGATKAGPVPSAIPTGAQQAPGSPQNGPLQLIEFYVYDVGVYPREVHTTKGVATSVTIEDVSGGTAGVIIERVTPNGKVPAGLVQRLGETSRGRTDFKLEPGHYQVYAEETPGTRADLIVDP